MFIHLNNTQTFIIISVKDSLNAGRLACTCITKKQTVICLSASDKGLCILNQLLFRNLISDKILQFHMRNSGNGLNLHLIILIAAYTESLMQTKLSYTKILIKLHHICHKFLGSLCAGQSPAHLADTVTDP